MTFAGLLAAAWHFTSSTTGPGALTAQTGGGAVSGEGKYKFRVLYTSTHLPAEAQKVLKAAHGGFAIDSRKGKGEVYFALPGAGIIQISSDLKTTKMMNTPEEMKGTNMHNALFWQTKDGKPYLTFPGNSVNRVFTTDMDGKLVNVLTPPTETTDMGMALANDYFKAKGPFIPTDVAQLNGLFYITTGYSKLDAVLTAKITPGAAGIDTAWNPMAFGGRGTGPGQLGTGHGITIAPGNKRIDVADRANAEIDRYDVNGKYLSTVNTPKGSLPCDIQYLDKKRAIIGALDGPDRTKGAPIYILENDKIVATVMPKTDLGLPNFTHIHNAIVREIKGKLYIIAQAWNPGDFAIFEQI